MPSRLLSPEQIIQDRERVHLARSGVEPGSGRVSFAQPTSPPPAPAFFTLLLMAQTALWLLGVGIGATLVYLLVGCSVR